MLLSGWQRWQYASIDAFPAPSGSVAPPRPPRPGAGVCACRASDVVRARNAEQSQGLVIAVPPIGSVRPGYAEPELGGQAFEFLPLFRPDRHAVRPVLAL